MNVTGNTLGSTRRWFLYCVLPWAVMIFISTNCSVVRADMRKAAQQAVAATVAIEWQTSVDAKEEGAADQAAGVTPLYPPLPAPLPQPSLATPLNVYGGVLASSAPESVSRASATVVSADGLLVTRIDVKQDEELEITLCDGRTLPAKLVVDDRRSGLQLLKIEAENLNYLEIADEPVELGQQVLTAACTGLQSREVADGIVAATNRVITDIPCDLLQTDALVSTMSAGGPLVDANGRLVGIVVAKDGRDVQQRGPAIAIPTQWVRALLQAAKGDERVVIRPGWLGITLESPTSKNGVPLVGEIADDQPAAKAGIRAGDEITAIDGHAVSVPGDVVREIGRRQGGDKVKIMVRRDDQQQEFEVTLGVRETPTRTAAADLPPRIQYIQPDRLIYKNNDSNSWVVPPGSVNPQQAAAALKAWQEAAKNSQGAAMQEALEAYQDALRSGSVTTPTIRVERSDVDKRLDELGSEIRSLQTQLKEIHEALKMLNQRLGESDGAK